MLAIILLISMAGAGFLAVVLLKELKNGDDAGNDKVSLRPLLEPMVPALGKGPVPDDRAGIIGLSRTNDFEEKCLKLERILDEKNRMLARLEEDLKSEQAHRGEFENLKDILQTQIEDLKAQNKKLKEAVPAVLQDNLAVQVKARPVERAEEPSVVRAEDPIPVKSDFDTFFGVQGSSSDKAPALSLNDVFNSNKDQKGE